MGRFLAYKLTKLVHVSLKVRNLSVTYTATFAYQGEAVKVEPWHITLQR